MRRAEVAVEAAELYEKYLPARDLERFLVEVDHTLGRSIESTQDRLAANTADVSQHDLLRLKTARGPLVVGLLAIPLASAVMIAADQLRRAMGRPRPS